MQAIQDYKPITIRIKPGSARAATFQQVFGRLDQIPVVFDEPETIFNAAGQSHKAYLLNLTRLSGSELTNLAIYYADLRRIMPDEARLLIKNSIIPIYADDCEVEL